MAPTSPSKYLLITITMEDSIYIYLLPFNERNELIILLDQNDKWQLLAKLMGYDDLTITSLKREKSPSDRLLNLWGRQNHKVNELFVLLSRMKHLEAMRVLRAHVPEKFLRLTRRLEREAGADAKPRNVVPHAGIASENFEAAAELKPNSSVADRKVAEFLNNPPEDTRDDNATSTNPFSAKSDGSYVAESGIPHIDYEELRKSTDNWDPANVLGKGGFGIVFKGTWKCTKVAIKRIEEKGSESPMNPVRQTVTELNSLNAYRHDNILPLYGFSFDGPHNCLVYQYMSGGSLERRLRDNPPAALDFRSRLRVAIGTARGIQFLHTTAREPLIHGDVKPANVLLDGCGTPRIGDFGLARKGPPRDRSHLTISRRQGTRPYLPDEYLRGGRLSTAVDTYSFGVVLFELATGLAVYSERRERRLLTDCVWLCPAEEVWELRDRRLDGEGDGEVERIFFGLIEIGKRCTERRAKDRPEMRDALVALEEVLDG